MASKPARAEPTRHRRIRLVVVQQLIGHLLPPGGNSQFFSIPVLALAMRKSTWSLPATTLRGCLASQPTTQNKRGVKCGTFRIWVTIFAYTENFSHIASPGRHDHWAFPNSLCYT